MDLIIVESPTKARTLTRFLKGKYHVEATMGHIRDLPKASLGVTVENKFAPEYIIPRDKAKRVKELKAIAAKASSIILATDPDREGEAIAWHISHILSQSPKSKSTKTKKTIEEDKETQKSEQYRRIVFHEITQSAIEEALNHPRFVDMQLVNAQQARRILDRLVGYKLSPLLWQKLSRRWLSAGRVQSVAVRLLVEREREINTFQKTDYWTVKAVFQTMQKNAEIESNLSAKDGKKYEQTLSFDLFDGTYTTTRTTIDSYEKAQAIITDLQAPFVVLSVEKKQTKRNPSPPFTTSTLQQEAARRLSYSSKKTMQLAQKLYEEGFISYHRTDSVTLSEKFISEARDYIQNKYTSLYLPETGRTYQTKSKVAQEAHEAIRPTTVAILSDQINHPELNRDHHRLYDLIWKRAVASQAKEALFDSTSMQVASANNYQFTAQGSVIVFDGYLKIAGRESEDTIIPLLEKGQEVNLKNAISEQHQTNPPPRYTEASLVKALEEEDIGRPSTYAPTISTIIERNYVVKEEKKLVPTELGFVVVDFLVKYFDDIVSLPFTRQMESSLDAIANGEKHWVPVISEFYGPFSQKIEKALQQAEKVKMPIEETGQQCPTCGNPLVLRMGRYGKFIACSTFPDCKYTKQYFEKIDKPCPKCGGDIIVKKSRSGKTFFGCANYPTCTFAAWKKEDIK